eukprot:358611-Chlamydomonas_euryale.AAC.3
MHLLEELLHAMLSCTATPVHCGDWRLPNVADGPCPVCECLHQLLSHGAGGGGGGGDGGDGGGAALPAAEPQAASAAPWWGVNSGAWGKAEQRLSQKPETLCPSLPPSPPPALRHEWTALLSSYCQPCCRDITMGAWRHGGMGAWRHGGMVVVEVGLRTAQVSVRVRVAGSRPIKGMPVLSVARQRGSSSRLGAVTTGARAGAYPAVAEQWYVVLSCRRYLC